MGENERLCATEHRLWLERSSPPMGRQELETVRSVDQRLSSRLPGSINKRTKGDNKIVILTRFSEGKLSLLK